MLYNVLILETVYPCWAYALARVGKSELFHEAWLKDKMPKLLQEYNGVLQEGDILVWQLDEDKNNDHLYWPIEMGAGGVISRKVVYKYHVCVYEGSGIVSDLAAEDNLLPLIVRQRKLKELSDPDYMIRF